jgi:catechol 2,3-dioxygenase-like lactoylglutathione lyase family enzyme
MAIGTLAAASAARNQDGSKRSVFRVPVEPRARAVYESGWRPAYAPGPTRDRLVEIIDKAAARVTGQESRSSGRRPARSVTAMNITIHWTFLPHDDADATLAFYRDALGFEVRSDVGTGVQRWITVGPVDQPGTSIVLHPPAAEPGITDEERRTITGMMAKGSYARIVLGTSDLDGTFERLRAHGADVVQEPTEQPWGVRDCAFRDPAGNNVRINELR